MAFKLGASVLSVIPGKKTGQSWAVDNIKSIGVWEGEELTDSGETGEGTLLGISTKFASMTKAMPKKKKPMTFSWSPTTREERVIFNSILRNRPFDFTVGVVDKSNNNYWMLNFRDVKLIRAPLHKRNVERIEVTFVEFYSETGVTNTDAKYR